MWNEGLVLLGLLVVLLGTRLPHAEVVVVELSAGIGAAELLSIPGAGAGAPQHGGSGGAAGTRWLALR